VNADKEKAAAATYAAGLVEPAMSVGLGSGSTAELAIQELGRKFANGLHFTAVASSTQTAALARSFGIPLARLDEVHELDLSIDGADEVDPDLNLVKGRGGALLREKLVATAARRFVVVVDSSKLVNRLGAQAPIPVEIVPFGWTVTRRRLETLGFTCELRRSAERIFTTNNHNYVLDCHAPAELNLADPSIGDSVKRLTGVVEHGLFLGMASMVVVGTPGGVEVLGR
jgi:ribose 5-phosphate isomerase A